LTNVAKHAHAPTVAVNVAVRDSALSLQVVDDGVGFAEDELMGRGIDNLRARASLLDGDFEIGRGETSGTVVVWRVPLKQPGSVEPE